MKLEDLRFHHSLITDVFPNLESFSHMTNVGEVGGGGSCMTSVHSQKSDFISLYLISCCPKNPDRQPLKFMCDQSRRSRELKEGNEEPRLTPVCKRLERMQN